MFKLWPVVGVTYVVIVDGSPFNVTVTETSAETNSVTYQYEGTEFKDKVSPDIFAFELEAFGRRAA